jgi:hypothetical protein
VLIFFMGFEMFVALIGSGANRFWYRRNGSSYYR